MLIGKVTGLQARPYHDDELQASLLEFEFSFSLPQRATCHFCHNDSDASPSSRAAWNPHLLIRLPLRSSTSIAMARLALRTSGELCGSLTAKAINLSSCPHMHLSKAAQGLMLFSCEAFAECKLRLWDVSVFPLRMGSYTLTQIL